MHRLKGDGWEIILKGLTRVTNASVDYCTVGCIILKRIFFVPLPIWSTDLLGPERTSSPSAKSPDSPSALKKMGAELKQLQNENVSLRAALAATTGECYILYDFYDYWCESL